MGFIDQVAMPTAAVTHIQKIAPGPPIRIAVATPPMFPLPTVEAKAVDRAWNFLGNFLGPILAGLFQKVFTKFLMKIF